MLFIVVRKPSETNDYSSNRTLILGSFRERLQALLLVETLNKAMYSCDWSYYIREDNSD